MPKFASGLMHGGLRSRPGEPTTVIIVGKNMGASVSATIDFRMIRRAYVERVRVGDVPRHDACDASVDLVRAAHHFGVARRTECPICVEQQMRNVTYLFGPRLPRSGKCVTSAQSLREFNSRPEQYTAYTVEVCMSCRWNHVLSAAPCGGRRVRSRAAKYRVTAARATTARAAKVR